MGFTGKRARQWKRQYIKAFNEMEEALKLQCQHYEDAAWIEVREQGKLVRREETDIIKQFVDYATEQGSKSANRYYMNLTKMTNAALQLVTRGASNTGGLRDMLNGLELAKLMIAEDVAKRALAEGMEQALPYKEIYQLAKQRVETFAGSIEPVGQLN